MSNQGTKISKWLWLLLLPLAAILIYLFGFSGHHTTPPNKPDKVTEEVQGTSTDVWYEVYFTSPVIPFNDVYTDGIETHLIEKINAAKSSIDVAVFEFDIESVAQALINAKNRGVDVKVVYDNDYSDVDPQIQELKNAGIEAMPDNRSAYMHDKFFVFDDKCIWTGSFNISMNAAYRNNENALYFCSDKAAENYSMEFLEMFEGKFGPSSPANTPYPEFTIDGVKIENYFAPEDNVMEKIIKVLNSATTSVHFMAYSFTDSDLAGKLMEKALNGVKIEGIFETSGANTAYSQCNALRSDGLDIRLDGNPRTFHHKVIIIDSKIVILGSFNFTSNANEQNDENILIVYDERLAKDYEDQFDLMFQQSIIPNGNTCTK